MKSGRMLHSSGTYNILKEEGYSWSKTPKNIKTVGLYNFFLKKKVALEFDFRIRAKKSGHLGHSFELLLFSVKELNERV